MLKFRAHSISAMKFAGLAPDLLRQIKQWCQENGFYYLASSVLHAFIFVCIALVSIFIPVAWRQLSQWQTAADDLSPVIVPDDVPEMLDRFEVGQTPIEPGELNAYTLMQTKAPGVEAKYYDDSPDFEEAGGGTPTLAKGPLLGGAGGFSLPGLDGAGGQGGVGVSDGSGEFFGLGGNGLGFDGRGEGHRDALVGAFGGTRASERAVGAALNWLFRHQGSAGNWSLQFAQHCTGQPCKGQGDEKADPAATGLALLPFLAAGQTHKSRGPYRQTINKGLAWLIKNQSSDGNLAPNVKNKPMYSHGIAAIALCEAYGMTQDEFVGIPARRAIAYIEQAQNKRTGGWRYLPGDSGDTSVLGWQVMALKSAQMAGLGVDTNGLESIRKWLNSVAKGEHEGLFSYVPYQDATPTMTAVGQLCYQYLGANRDDPRMIEGKDYLSNNPPDNSSTRNSYYWYYATMVMHNFLGPEWDAWNRQMRRVLIESQEKEGCAMGSWDPENPTTDAWGTQGGRLMTTCFAALTLEVYYRYLPLYQFRSPEGEPAKTPPGKPR
jgi:hypothetical protein